MIKKKIIIKGKVQGVGFRFFAKQKASIHNIKGMAKNNLDFLEIIAICDNEEEMNEFIKELKRGPMGSRIDSFNVVDEEFDEDFDDYNSFLIVA